MVGVLLTHQQRNGINEMNKLEKLINRSIQLGKIMDEQDTAEAYTAAESTYKAAVNKLTLLANKIGEDKWNEMLNVTGFAKSHYKWFNFRDYMVKQA